MLLKMLMKFLGQSSKTNKPWIQFSDYELEYMWADDTVDIKNLGRMDDGSDKDELRAILSERWKWYNKQGLTDWAEQIDIGLSY